MPMPSCREVGRISSSMPRETREYSIWRSGMGLVPCFSGLVLIENDAERAFLSERLGGVQPHLEVRAPRHGSDQRLQ
jgi:hypothetical protein